jgi:hypothetical protein
MRNGVRARIVLATAMTVIPMTAVWAQGSGGAHGGGQALATHRVIVNGRPVDGDVAPVAIDGVLFVPIRFVSEYLGGRVDWDNTKQEATINRNAHVIRMTIGSTRAYLDSEGRALSNAPVLRRNRTLIPLREVSRLMDAQVQYNPNSQVVFITVPKGSVEPPSRVGWAARRTRVD